MSQDGTRKSAVTFTLPVTAETFPEKDIQATIAGANMVLNILFMSVTFFSTPAVYSDRNNIEKLPFQCSIFPGEESLKKRVMNTLIFTLIHIHNL
ncbi:hypothetical protein CEL20_09485 [Salmonella enterica subsp. enterica serovar Oranienburg]|nr:hypothetical protein [Salmonella enterica]ECS6612721.1 hypothetical protein [Salmonella enterica subsp. enterica serovar Give]ECS7052011.1 hypothetical protein [Salmonella enterica subsp. enterica serovar Oranienburg]EAQ0191942.1 hypothetical protein [Salmonella enterica]EAU7078372.1 hypothetical protein [Salmonella enterica]